MENNDELKEIGIKNCMFNYFDDIMTVGDFDLNVSLEEIWCKNILIYEISYLTFTCTKLLRIRFDKVDGFIKVRDGTRHLVLFGPERNDAIYNRIRYLRGQKSAIT